MFTLISVSKKSKLASVLMLHTCCLSMHACSPSSVMSYSNDFSWGSKLRNSLPASLSSAWEKSCDRFDALPTSYKYAIGGGATLLLAGGAFLGYKKFAVQKQNPLQNSAHVITVLGNPDPVARYIEQFTAVGRQKKFPTEDEFAQFQNVSDIGPTQVLLAVCKGIYVGCEEFAHHWSILAHFGGNLFAPSIAVNEVNAFVSLANKFEPELILSVVQHGRGLYKECPKKELLAPDEIKAGIKATLVQLLAKTGFEKEFNTIVDIVDNGCTNPEIAFTASDWHDVLVAAGLNIVNEEGYIRLLELFSSEVVITQAPSCSSSSSVEDDAQSGPVDFELGSARASTPFFNVNIEIEGVQCSVKPRYNNDGSFWYYAIAFKRDASNHSSDHNYFSPEGLSGYIVQELRNEFGLKNVSEESVRAFLIQSKVPGFVLNNESEQLMPQATLCAFAMSVDEVWPDID